MGQYFKIINLDKKEFLHPHVFGDGLKLLEFGCSADGTMTALALLLRRSNGSGGGDYHGSNQMVGSWAGDRIVIIGDYDDSKLYNEAERKYKNISEDMRKVMKEEGIVSDNEDTRILRKLSLNPDVVLVNKE